MITPRATFIKELVDPEHQLFHHRIQSCSYNLDRHHLSRVLIDNMIHHEGIGISANQIGIWERAFAMVRDLENNEVMVCFNPRIIKSYSEEVEMEEGCLSYPELFLKIKNNKTPSFSLNLYFFSYDIFFKYIYIMIFTL